MVSVTNTHLIGVKKITPPTLFQDFRGEYIELYNRDLYRKAGVEIDFVQDDISVSTKNVLRGIHGDQVTTKLISCLLGKIYLVIVNCDEQSEQYRKWQSFIISDKNRYQILVPPRFGVAHYILTEKAIFHYKQSTYYNRESQFTIRWDDPNLAIDWPVKDPILSARDATSEIKKI
ncbi:MAG: dTDP-4-dehydrorhamnose 3,5-epimerase family protein [Fidelibacterota bacterium]